MASITDLRQKRAALWEKTKKFLDNAKRENDMRQRTWKHMKKWRVKLLLSARR